MFRVKPERVDIWRVDLTQARGLLLSQEEMQRAARFHFEHDRVRWSRAHSALRQILSEYTGTAPLELSFESGEHGKPALTQAPIEFNLSHSGDWAVVAVSQCSPVGVDIERVRDGVDMPKLLRRIGEDPQAAEPFRHWALREARTKAAGIPLMQTPPSGIFAAAVDVPAGYAGAVAVVGAEPQPVYRS